MKNKEKYDLEKIKVFTADGRDGIALGVSEKLDENTIIFKSKYYPVSEMVFGLREVFNWLESEYKEPIKLTDDEKAILRSLPKEYKWIARNGGDWLCVYTNKPTKCDIMWNSCDGYRYWIDIFNHLFQFIKWSDNEPWNIEELLKDE